MVEPFAMYEGALPPKEVRINNLSAESYPDGRRVKVSISVTPFSQRPNLNICIWNNDKYEVSNASIIEAMTYQIGLTMHIKPAQIGLYSLHVEIYYPDFGLVDQRTLDFEITQ
jgi:hypothetical protein